MGHNGLALAVSLAAFVNFVMQLAGFRKKLGLLGLRKIAGGLSKTKVSTVLMMALLWMMRGYLIERFGLAAGLPLLILLGVVSFVGSELLLGGREVREVVGLLRRKRTGA